MRARLHLLLRAAGARLYGPVAGTRFRESKLFFKPDAAQLLERELSKPGYRCERVHIGGNTDPYQPIERKLRITRQVLEVLDRFNHPLSIITKSALIVRDADILGPHGQAQARRRRSLGDHASTASWRAPWSRGRRRRTSGIERIRGLAEAGCAGVRDLRAGDPRAQRPRAGGRAGARRRAGATSAGYVALRLPLEIKDLFRNGWRQQRPGPRLARHVADPPDARRQGLRLELGLAHAAAQGPSPT